VLYVAEATAQTTCYYSLCLDVDELLIIANDSVGNMTSFEWNLEAGGFTGDFLQQIRL